MSGLNIFHMKIQVGTYSERRLKLKLFLLLTHIAYASVNMHSAGRDQR